MVEDAPPCLSQVSTSCNDARNNESGLFNEKSESQTLPCNIRNLMGKEGSEVEDDGKLMNEPPPSLAAETKQNGTDSVLSAPLLIQKSKSRCWFSN